MNELSSWRDRRLPKAADTEPDYGYHLDADEPSVWHYWNILVKHRYFILVMLVLVFAPGAYFALSATTLYTAAGTIKIEPHNPQVTGLGDLQPVELRSQYDYHQTQFALLQSRTLAARVITELRLESNKTFTNSSIITPNPIDRVKSWIFHVVGIFSSYLAPLFKSPAQPDQFEPFQSISGEGNLELTVSSSLINRYLGFINIAPVINTRLVRVEFTTPDPALSQALANAHVQHFIRMSLDSRFSLTAEARDFLDQKKAELAKKLEVSEAALNKFRRAHGVVSLEKGENIVVDRLVELNRQLTAARAQRIEAESLHRTVENKNYQDLAEIMKQGLVQQLNSNVANLEAEKARVGTVFKPDHPRIQELNQQIAAARQAFNNEITNVVRGIKSNYASAAAKERALEGEAAKQQGDALRLRELGVNYTLLEEDVKANRSLYESVLKRLSETNVSNDLAVSNIQIAERAAIPLGPSGPNVPIYLLASMVSGLFLGIGAAFLREFFDATVATPDDVWRAVGLGTLGVVPHLKYLNESIDRGQQTEGMQSEGEPRRISTEGTAPAKELTINYRPHSLISESYRNIRTSLLLSQAEKPPQVILLTSPSPKEGKTVTGLNLAIALAQDGYSTLLVDGDMRMGCCHDRLGMRNNRGLSNVLTGRLSLAEGLQQTRVRGLSLLSRGIPPPNPSELLGSRRMKQIVAEVRGMFEFILIDSPPAIAISDAAILSVLSDGVVLVFQGETTSIPHAQRAVERLDTVRAPLLGVVLNGVNLNNPDYSYYRAYSSYYDHNSPNRDDGTVEFNSKGSGNPGYTTDIVGKSRRFGSKAPSAAKDVSDERETIDNGLANSSKNAACLKNTAEIDEADALLSRRDDPLKISQSAPPEEGTQPTRVLAARLNRLIQDLTIAIGPMAPQIIREQIANLGESRYAFPESRIDELLKLIERELTDEEWTSFSTHYFKKS